MHENSSKVTPFQRLHSLDGLRGVAAVIVLMHHSLLLVPALAANYYGGNASRDYGQPVWWMTYTPLHLLWEGKAAVYIFFVLSGMVLTLPVIKTARFSWIAYFPQRLLRLYLPVWAAVIFAVFTIAIVPRIQATSSDWLNARTDEITLNAIVKDSTLLFGTGGLASPLWSLKWEIVFSLLLPLFVWIGRRCVNFAAPGVLLCLGMISLGGFLDRDAMRYLPMFMIGVLLANAAPQVAELAERIVAGRYRRLTYPIAAFLALFLLNAHWTATLLGATGPLLDATIGLTTTGAVLMILMSVLSPSVSGVLKSRIFQKLGAISFSLYLIHEPIVILFGFIFDGHLVIATSVSILTSLLAAGLFFLLIERPSHKLARRVHLRITATHREGAIRPFADEHS